MNRFTPSKRQVLIFISAILLLFLTVWMVLTPAGLDGKLRAIAYAVCEQNPDHSLQLGASLLPLCSRCTGMYLGMFTALAFFSGQGRKKKFPSKGKGIILVLLTLFFIVDGVNSTVATFAPQRILYTPSNALRLISGMEFGLVFVNVILPVWHQTFWTQGEEEPLLGSWWQLLRLILLEAVIAGLILMGFSWLYWPVALLSTGTVVIMITMVYTLLGMVIFKKENLIHRWKEGMLYLLLGLLAAFIQIGLFELVRLLLTGTWQAIL